MTCKEDIVKINKNSSKKCRKVDNVLKPGLTPPDGGWGWVVVATAGLSTSFCLSVLMCYGLIFRERFEQLGINATKTTTILNIHAAVGALAGLANGPLFRKYSYRQVALVSGFGCAISICALSFMKTFYGILFFFSILYAIARNILMTANLLAVLAYFEKKRQIAVGLTWAYSGIGCIISPQLATILMSTYGIPGTVLIFGGLMFNTIVCALTLQPVAMHAKKATEYESVKTTANEEIIKERDEDSTAVISRYEKTHSIGNVSCPDKLAHQEENRLTRRYGVECFHCCGEESVPAVVDVIALRNLTDSRSNNDWYTYFILLIYLVACILTLVEIDILWVSCSDPNDCERKRLNGVTSKEQIVITKSSEDADDDEKTKKNDYANVDNNDDNIEHLLEKSSSEPRQKPEQNKLQWCTYVFNAVVVLFNLELLQDCIFLNLLFGVSTGYFTILNFLYLIPYILSDLGLRDSEIATVLSVFSTTDVLSRLIVPIIATRVGWNNRTFFLIGIGSSALGRITFAYLSTYSAIMVAGVLSGYGKGLVIVFTTLVISDHVPLEKMPGATGLEMVSQGIVFLLFGPLLGWFKDTWGNYTFLLHFLNVFCYLVIVSWMLEYWCCTRKRQ